MNGKVISAVLVTAVLAIAMVPAMADDADGEEEYGPMEIHFYDKEGGRILLIQGLSDPDFVVPSGIPSVKGSYGWSIYGVEYPGRDLVGTSFKSYAVSAAFHPGIVVLNAYPMFEEPAPAETGMSLDTNMVIAIILVAIVLVALIGFVMAGGGKEDCTGRGSYSPFYDDGSYRRP